MQGGREKQALNELEGRNGGGGGGAASRYNAIEARSFEIR